MKKSDLITRQINDIIARAKNGEDVPKIAAALKIQGELVRSVLRDHGLMSHPNVGLQYDTRPRMRMTDAAIAKLYAGQRYENYKGREVMVNELPPRPDPLPGQSAAALCADEARAVNSGHSGGGFRE